MVLIQLVLACCHLYSCAFFLHCPALSCTAPQWQLQHSWLLETLFCFACRRFGHNPHAEREKEDEEEAGTFHR